MQRNMLYQALAIQDQFIVHFGLFIGYVSIRKL